MNQIHRSGVLVGFTIRSNRKDCFSKLPPAMTMKKRARFKAARVVSIRIWLLCLPRCAVRLHLVRAISRHISSPPCTSTSRKKGVSSPANRTARHADPHDQCDDSSGVKCKQKQRVALSFCSYIFSLTTSKTRGSLSIENAGIGLLINFPQERMTQLYDSQ